METEFLKYHFPLQTELLIFPFRCAIYNFFSKFITISIFFKIIIYIWQIIRCYSSSICTTAIHWIKCIRCFSISKPYFTFYSAFIVKNFIFTIHCATTRCRFTISNITNYFRRLFVNFSILIKWRSCTIKCVSSNFWRFCCISTLSPSILSEWWYNFSTLFIIIICCLTFPMW